MVDPQTIADSFEHEVARLLPEVMGFFSRRISADAEDCGAETLLAALAARQSFRGKASVRTFVFRIAHRVLARRRKLLLSRAKGLDLDHLEAPAEVGVGAEICERFVDGMIADALSAMDGALKEMLELTFVEGKSRRELAAQLQLSPGTVAARLQRAKAMIRSLLEDAARRQLSESNGLGLHTREFLREIVEQAG